MDNYILMRNRLLEGAKIHPSRSILSVLLFFVGVIYKRIVQVLCDELFHKFIHRRERSQFAGRGWRLSLRHLRGGLSLRHCLLGGCQAVVHAVVTSSVITLWRHHPAPGCWSTAFFCVSETKHFGDMVHGTKNVCFDPISRYMKWAGPTRPNSTRPQKMSFFLMVFPFIWVWKWIFFKNDTWILFYFWRAFQVFLQILKIRIPSRVMSKKQRNFNIKKWFFLVFGFENEYFSKNET